MEYIAEIIKEKRISKQFWEYTFRDIKTGKEDKFISNYPIPYTPDLIGKLLLSWDKKKRCKLYQDFNQNIANLKETEKEEDLGLWEKIFEKKIKEVENELTREPPKLFKTHEEFIEHLNQRRKELGSWEKVAKEYNRNPRVLRRWRNKPFRPKQKRGPKFKIDRKSFYHLIHSIQTEEAQTLKEMSNYIVNKGGLPLSKQTIRRILEKIKYSYHGIHYRNPKQKQNLAEALDFMEKVSKLTPHLILSTDESGFPLNLARKKAWGPMGKKITRFNKHYATNYTLLLMIRNTDKGGIIHWDLFKGAVNTEIFTNFINNIELPTDEKYYLLLDKLPVHETKKVEKALENKNVEPRFIVAANPWINPTELVFHVIKDHVKKYEPRTEKDLRRIIDEKVNKLQEEGMTKYFKDCLDFDFILKSGH